MHKPIENIRQEWEDFKVVRNHVKSDFQQWPALKEVLSKLVDRLNKEIGLQAELIIQDKFPKVRDLRLSLHHIFPLGDELVAYNNSATLVFEQRLSGQIFIWYLFPQKEHFSRLEGLQAKPAKQFRIDQLLQDENLILFQIETFLSELKGWMKRVLPESAEEKTALEF